MLLSEIKIGIVGLGKMGMLHLEKLIQNPRVVVSGVWDIDPKRTDVAMRAYRVNVFQDLDSLFFDSDAVVIATPTPTHFLIAQKALQQDLHVFLEKPVAQTLPEGLELARLAQLKGRILQTGFLERYRWIRLKDAMPELWSTHPQLISTERSSSEPSRDPEADIVSDLMIHDIDFVLWSLGKKPISVQAEGMSLRGSSLDLAYARLEFKSGEVAHLKAQWVAPQRTRTAQIFWKKNRLHFDLLTQKVSRADFLGTGGFKNFETEISGPDPLTDQLNAFVSAIEGTAPVLVDGHQGCLAQEICEVIKKSIQAKMKIVLSPSLEKEKLPVESQGEYVN